MDVEACQSLNIKDFFVDYFTQKNQLCSRNIDFMPYKPSDEAFGHYSSEDWEIMFPGVKSEEFNKWTELDDRVVLSAYDKDTSNLFGVLCFVSSSTSSTRLYFHGGTCYHSTRYILLAYEGLIYILNLLLSHRFEILVTCVNHNLKAHRFQNSLGFKEFHRDEELSYKFLTYGTFLSNPIVSRFLH